MKRKIPVPRKNNKKLNRWVVVVLLACAKVLSCSGKPSYKSIKNPLATMKENLESALLDSDQLSSGLQTHGITRCVRYYGGEKSWSIKAP